LQRQADELGAESSALLARVGLRRGDSALDLGCGPRGVLELLSDRVSPGGRVVGLDADAAHVAMASRFAADRGLSDVEIVCADARHTGLEGGSFDLVHARALLVTVPEPAEVLAEMVRLVRPGGWVVGLEPDGEVAICYPPHPAFDRLCELSLVAFPRNGADPRTGRRLGELYRQAGLEQVTVEVRAAVYPAGHSRRAIPADLVRSLRRQVIEMGLADDRELDRLDHAARRHLDNPETVVMPFLNFLAWGRKRARHHPLLYDFNQNIKPTV
jgi:ubiquinone/menaquinone biosynthesis C-methylase UbiE